MTQEQSLSVSDLNKLRSRLIADHRAEHADLDAAFEAKLAELDKQLAACDYKPVELRDLQATEIVGVQIDSGGQKLWVCVDGACVLRVKTPAVHVVDDRQA